MSYITSRIVHKILPDYNSFFLWKKRRKYHSCQMPESMQTKSVATLYHATLAFVLSAEKI